MRRFLLRCTLAATSMVAFSSSAVLGQSEPTTDRAIARGTMPAIVAPQPLASEIVAPTLALAELPTATIDAPTMMDLSVGTVLAPAAINEDVSSVVRRRAAFGRPAVLMITGGALLLTGLLVDGDASSILIIAGAGIGGYGLYLHLQSPNARLRR